MAHSNDEIRGVLIQAGEHRLLLPNATVAEVLTRAPVEPIADMPDWLPGRIDWHGWPVPLVAFGRLTGNANDPVALNSKIVVLKALSGDKDRPYFALLTPSFPRLVSVPRAPAFTEKSTARDRVVHPACDDSHLAVPFQLRPSARCHQQAPAALRRRRSGPGGRT